MTAANAYKVAIVPGDGIGIEVTRQGRRILELLADKGRLPINLIDAEYGEEAYHRTGKLLPDSTRAALSQADAILFGAAGGPGFETIPVAERKAGSLLALRRNFDLFANLRPVKALPELYGSSSLKQHVVEGVDMIIVRELVGGVYFGEPRGIETLADGQRRGVNTHVYTTSQIERVARAAFDLARGRKGRVCSVAKENVMEAGRLWREVVQHVHDAEYRDVELHHMLADNCAMQLVRAPSQFDVLVTDNLFGDILSDCAAMVTGSLGMLPSASLGPVKDGNRRPALYEPVHGSAPDIAGKRIANPIGSILSVAMMLRHSFNSHTEADLVESAVAKAISAGARTADIAMGGKFVSTIEMGDAIVSELAGLLPAVR